MSEEINFRQPLCTVEEAKEIAQEIFNKYDYEKTGILGKSEIGPLMMDTYKSMHVMYNPSLYDVESFAKLIDTDGDFKVTQEDLEKCAIKFLASQQQ